MAVEKTETFDNVVLKLRDTIVENLKQTNPSTNLVLNAEPSSGIIVDAVVEDFRYVSGAARALAGVLSGKARLGVKVKLRDASTNEVIGESKFGTSSKISEGVFGGVTSRQIKAVAVSVAYMISDASNK